MLTRKRKFLHNWLVYKTYTGDAMFLDVKITVSLVECVLMVNCFTKIREIRLLKLGKFHHGKNLRR